MDHHSHRLASQHRVAIAAALIMALLLLAAGSTAADPSSQRPLSDFIGAQGITSVFVPPVPDYVGWATSSATSTVGLFALVDYAGLAAAWIDDSGGPSLGTSVTGQVHERPLADGRALVTVVLHTSRALTWAMPVDFATCCDFANDPLAFGYRPADLVGDPSLTPGLAEVHFQVVFKNTAPGAPLPDLVDAFILGNALPGQEQVSISISAKAQGPLRAASGFDEGRPGRAVITEIGVLSRGLDDPTRWPGARSDGFTVEQIDLRPLGK